MTDIFRQAATAHQSGNLAEAERLYRAAIAAPGDSVPSRQNLAMILMQKGAGAEAEQMIARAAELSPREPALHHNHALILTGLARNDEAVAAATRAIALQPGHAMGFLYRAHAQLQAGRAAEAIADYKKAIGLGRQGDPSLYFGLGHALSVTGALDEALDAYNRAIKFKPDFLQALLNRGQVLGMLGRHDEALKDLDRVIANRPDVAQAHDFRGLSLAELRRAPEAVAAFQKSLSLDPNNPAAWRSLGNLLNTAGAYEQAGEAYDRAMALDKNLPFVRDMRLHAAMYLNDWRAFDARVADILADVGRGMPVQPFLLNIIPSSPALRLKAAQSLSAFRCPPQPAMFTAPRKPGRLRIAYVSAMFRNHPGPLLVTGMLERHDRDQFEIFGISHGANDNSEIRARMVAALDHFVDVPHLSDAAIAATIADLGIDIAIDLDGYTEDARPAILSHRPAPIQISYLGFPASMGARHYDYIIGDAIVTPEEQAPFFMEKIARLPFTYQPNGARPDLPAQTRAAHGLPENAFVFGCFNSNHKIAPADLDSWARILNRVPDSVLWLLAGNETAKANLGREATMRGLDPSRIIFAERTGWQAHLARQALMDLFLDTFIYGAHTTASDLLWAGVPLMTRLGEAFPARVGASILHAAGLPELITHSAQDYENLAVALAEDKARLAALKDKIRSTRNAMPLFDAARYTRHFEAALRAMWDRHEQGGKPESFSVAP